MQLGKKPLLVSHSPAFNIESHQRKLASAVRDRFQQIWSFPLIRVGIHRTGSDPSDYSQRTRSFLFASFSSAVANLVGLADVFLADNGVVSLNLPVNGQLVGAKASRSTHPKFLKLFNCPRAWIGADYPACRPHGDNFQRATERRDPDRDCRDFDAWTQSQYFYEASGGPDRDPHRLDGDRDGIACESLPAAP